MAYNPYGSPGSPPDTGNWMGETGGIQSANAIDPNQNPGGQASPFMAPGLQALQQARGMANSRMMHSNSTQGAGGQGGNYGNSAQYTGQRYVGNGMMGSSGMQRANSMITPGVGAGGQSVAQMGLDAKRRANGGVAVGQASGLNAVQQAQQGPNAQLMAANAQRMQMGANMANADPRNAALAGYMMAK